jgi:hypothetical protein
LIDSRITVPFGCTLLRSSTTGSTSAPRSRSIRLREGARTAEHQQAAAAAIDELRDHLQLIAGQRGRFEAADDQRAIREQLFARLRKRRDQLVGPSTPCRMYLLSAVRIRLVTIRLSPSGSRGG